MTVDASLPLFPLQQPVTQYPHFIQNASCYGDPSMETLSSAVALSTPNFTAVGTKATSLSSPLTGWWSFMSRPF